MVRDGGESLQSRLSASEDENWGCSKRGKGLREVPRCCLRDQEGCVVVGDVTQLVEDGGSRRSGDAEVLGHKLFKVLCFIRFVAHSLGDVSHCFSTCFKVWVYSTCHVFFFNVAATQFYLTGKNVFALLPR